MTTKLITLTALNLLLSLCIVNSGYSQCLPDLPVSTQDGETEVDICLGSLHTTVNMRAGDIASPYLFAITDDQGIILDVSFDPSIDFGDADPGICRIYGVSWWGLPQKPIGESISEAIFSDFCYEVSPNFITVNRMLLGAGTVTGNDSSTVIYTCPGDSVADLITFNYDGSSEGNFTFIITDPEYNILGIPEGNSQDFEGAGEGTCLVWGLNYLGDLLAEVGQNARQDQLATGCFGLSENSLEVVRAVPEAGEVETSEGLQRLDLCVGDGVADAISFQAPGRSAAQFRIVVTDENNEILGLPDGPLVDFDGAGEGICRVWGVSYTGNFLLNLGENFLEASVSDGCSDRSEGYVEVVRTFINGGMVSMPSGATKRYTCTQDDSADVVQFQHDSVSETNYVYIITSPDLEILGIEHGDSHDFNDAPPGTCWVWGLAYTGNLTAQIGDQADQVSLSDSCYDLSDNYIEVVRDVPDGGMVSMPSGATERYTCAQDGTADVVKFRHDSASQSKYAYIITSPDLDILGVTQADSNDFDGAPPGTCWVWGLAYTGNLTAEVGQNAGDVPLSDDCFDLSDNYITVIRDIPDGGRVITPVGDTTVFTCPQDGQADLVTFAHEGASNSKYAYIITSPTLEVLGVPSGDQHDFDDAPPGICWVWGVAYTGELLVEVGDQADSVALSDDCFDLSDNYIEVIRERPEGGMVSMPSGDTAIITCTQDSLADVVMFEHQGASQSEYAYLITNPDLEILGITTDDRHDFNDAPPGTCWVWGLAYTGTIIAQVGDRADQVALTSDCYDLSDNFITVIRQVPDGGIVQTPSGDSVIFTCAQDGNPDVVFFERTNTFGPNYTYIITNPDLVILGIEPAPLHDFDDAPPGTCWVWGMAYFGNLIAEIGDTVGVKPLSDVCYDLSDNFLEIIRDVPEGGRVQMPGGDTVRYTCTQDGEPDLVFFEKDSVSNSKYVYIITSPDLEILGIEFNDSHDFDDAPPGTCWVWGMAYTGELIAEVGDTVGLTPLTDDCFDLSDNFIEVIRDQPEGGTVQMPSGQTTRYTCTQDENADEVLFESTGASNSKYAWIITSPDLEILGIETKASHDFDDAPPGTCWVWGLAYTGNLTAKVGDQADAVALSDECFDLSDNYIEIIRDIPNGGTVQMPSGETMRYTCAQDSMPDVVMFEHLGASNSKYAYIITSPDLEILGIESTNNHDFDNAPPGTCWVWGLAYTGNLTAEIGDHAGSTALSDDCYDLSDNFIEVIRDVPDGGMVETDGGLTEVSITTGDGAADIINFTSSGASNSLFTYIITDDENKILSIPLAGSQDFDPAGPGVCRVWGLSYTGTLLAKEGDLIDDSMLADDCYDLSDNFIEITRIATAAISRLGGTRDSPLDLIELQIVNPVRGRIQGWLHSPAGQEIIEIRLFSNTGTLMATKQLPAGLTTTLDWDISHLIPGVYVLTVVHQEGTVSQRLILQ